VISTRPRLGFLTIRSTQTRFSKARRFVLWHAVQRLQGSFGARFMCKSNALALLHPMHPLAVDATYISPISDTPRFTLRLELTTFQKFNLSAIVMGVGIPVAWVLAPSVLVFPIDLAIGIALPYHMAHGVGDVAMDYAPMHLREMAKKLIYLISILAALGFLKINLCGPGITMSVKSLWKKPAKKDAAAAAPAKA